MTGRSRVARMVRAGTSSALASHTAMWPSRDADGLIITEEPAPCVAAGSVENEDSPYQLKPDLVYYLLTACVSLCRKRAEGRRRETIIH